MPENPYLPHAAVVRDIAQETSGERAVRTFTVDFEDENVSSNFKYRPGQLAMISVFGRGESMISMTSSPTMSKSLQFAIMRYGRVTSVLHYLEIGEKIGVRGPYGNGFPVADWKGKSLLFIGGGIGIAPLRSAYMYALDNRKDYGEISIFYGARSSQNIVFRKELESIAQSGKAKVELSIDKPEDDWKGFVGFVPANVKRLSPTSDNTIAIACGPVVMIKVAIDELLSLGFAPERIFTTMENKMKCGIGKCGRCNIGSVLVCKKGPVFSYDQIQKMPRDF
ncbi:MAG: FAD/NAD(P)-binding protein [Thermoplasmata archaeon]|nr:FAD/NAD(P)-binding protein [Thermoplasmata archaeon]